MEKSLNRKVWVGTTACEWTTGKCMGTEGLIHKAYQADLSEMFSMWYQRDV